MLYLRLTEKKSMHRALIIEKVLVIPPLLPLVAKPNHCRNGEEALSVGEKKPFYSSTW